MNLAEFKAWFQGYTEGMTGMPNQKQWARIQERVAQIQDALPTSYHTFIHEYRPYPWYPAYWNIGDSGVGQTTYTPSVAFHALGCSDFAESTNAV